MADNTVSFEITANTKPAGKALLELSRLINKAVTIDVKGQEKSVIKQQNEYKKLAKEVNNAFKEIDKLNKEDKKSGNKAGLPFNQYAANAKKIADLEEKKSNTTDLKERKQLNAEISKYKSINNRMDDYAKQVLKQILGTEKAIVSDEQSIFGIRTSQVGQTKKVSDDTKNIADNENEINKTVKETSSALEGQAKTTKETGDAFNKTTKEATSAQAKRIEEARKEVQGLSATIDRILSKNFGGPDKFTFAEFDRAKEDLTELRDLLKLLGIPEEFKADYNKIVEALDKIARGKRMLTKENAEAEKHPVLPTKKIEDEAAAAEQRLYELGERAKRVLSQMMDPNAISLGDLKRREAELQSLKKAMEDMHIPKELDQEYQRVSAELLKCRDSIASFNKEATKQDGEENLSDLIIRLNELNRELSNLRVTGKDTSEVEEQIAKTTEEINERLTFDSSAQSAYELKQYVTELGGALKTLSSIKSPMGLDDLFKRISVDYEAAGQKLKKFKGDVKTSLDIRDATQNMNSSFQSIIDTLDRVEQKMKMTTGQASLTDLLHRLAELEQARKTLKDFGFPTSMERQLVTITNLIAQTKQEIKDYQRNSQDAANASSTLGTEGEKAGRKVERATSRMAPSLKSAGSSIKILKDGFKGLSRVSDKVKSSFDGMARNMRSNFKHMLTSLTKYVLGFRSLFFLVRRLRKYLGEGIQNLVQFESGANPVNEAITDMLSSLLYLKNAWAAAFAPVIMFVRPILVSLIDMLAEVGNAVARFLSFILQSEVTFNAVRVSAGDYADSLGGVGDSAGGAADKVKKLTDRLAAFDDLNVLGKDNDDDTTGSGGGGGGGASDLPSFNDMFKIVDNEENEFLKRLKESWSKADFTWLGELLRDKIIEGLDWLNSQWDTIQEYADKIGHSLGSFLVGLLGDPELWEKSGHAIGEAFNTINIGIAAFLDELEKIPFGKNGAMSVNEFLQTTDWELAGENIGTSLHLIISNINDFIENLSAEDVATAITDFVERLDIPQLAADVDEFVFNATNFVIELLGNVLIQSGQKFGDALTKWVSEGVQTAYVDKNGVHVQIGFELQTDWTEHPIIALFERIANAISATIVKGVWRITLLFGFDWDLGEFIEQADHAFDATGVNDFFNGIEQGFFSVLDLATGWDVASAAADGFNDSVAHVSGGFSHCSETAAETNTTISEFTTTAYELKDTITGVTDQTALMTNNMSNMGVVGQQTTDTLVTGFNTANDTVSGFTPTVEQASASIDTYNSNVNMAVEQSNANLTNSANTTGAWQQTVSGAVDNTKESWDELGNTVSVNGGVYINTVTDLETETGNVHLSVTSDFSDMADGVSESTSSMSDTINTTWTTLGTEVPENVTLMTDEVYNKFFELSENIKPVFEDIRLTVSTKMQETRVLATTEASTLNVNLYNLFLKTQQEGTQQFNTLGDNIVSAFANMASNSKGPMNRFLDAVESMVNHATDALNRLIDNVNECLKMGSDWLTYMGLPDIGQQSHVPYASIPRLAQGAVIPPNREFLAVLGDQSHGTNIEAPLDTIKQAVAEVLATNNSNGEVVELLQELIRVVEDKDLTIGDKEIGKANARYVNKQRLIRGTSF